MENNGGATSKTQMRPSPWNKGKLIGPNALEIAVKVNI